MNALTPTQTPTPTWTNCHIIAHELGSGSKTDVTYTLENMRVHVIGHVLLADDTEPITLNYSITIAQAEDILKLSRQIPGHTYTEF